MHWSLASEHFQFQDRSFAATLDEFATYCAFIKKRTSLVENIVNLRQSPLCISGWPNQDQGSRKGLVVGIWYLSKTSACLRLTKPKDPCRESIHGKTTLLLYIGICQHTQGSLKQYSIGKLWGKLFKNLTYWKMVTTMIYVEKHPDFKYFAKSSKSY